MTISGENCHDLLDLYTLVTAMGIEFANAVVHNSFYFHKADNHIEDLQTYERIVAQFIENLLRSPRTEFRKRLKDWFRAYLNVGLLQHARGEKRPIPCTAGTDTFFLDPHGLVLACNGSSAPMVMGDLVTHSFEEIWQSEKAAKIRRQVRDCKRDCWMTGTAVPAMRKNPWIPLLWVLRNKARIWRGQSLPLY
jgi:sulfatase maturation enzyme AslB (radical SAM superfamily)